MKFKIIIITVAIIFLPLYCQEIPPVWQPQDTMRYIENDALLRMINDIEITDSQMPEFISKFRQMAMILKGQRENRARLIEVLQESSFAEESAGRIISKIDEFERSQESIDVELKKIRNDMKKILKPDQQIKFLLMFDEIKNMLSLHPEMPVAPFQESQRPARRIQSKMVEPVRPALPELKK